MCFVNIYIQHSLTKYGFWCASEVLQAFPDFHFIQAHQTLTDHRSQIKICEKRQRRNVQFRFNANSEKFEMRLSVS